MDLFLYLNDTNYGVGSLIKKGNKLSWDNLEVIVKINDIIFEKNFVPLIKEAKMKMCENNFIKQSRKGE